MCRWSVYAGPEVFLADIIFNQQYSLIKQSLLARESVWKTNGDGFGIAWYGTKKEPGIFKDTLPAWNDENLRSLAEQVESRLFFAHVRATTGTSISRNNCHPFKYKNWIFMHNGQIGGWAECRKDIESMIDHRFYSYRLGTTDSEALFLVALSEGLEDDPPAALGRAISRILCVMQDRGVHEPMRISCACSDGDQVWALRFSTDGQSPTLYYGTPATHAREHFDGQVCISSLVLIMLSSTAHNLSSAGF